MVSLKYLCLGAVVNVLVAWAIVAILGRVPFEWRPYFNPRAGDPIAFFVIDSTGSQWVVGCSRPGTLVDRHPDDVCGFHGAVWWPPEAVALDDDACARAAGWPMLSLFTWRTSAEFDPPGKQAIASEFNHHWGIVMREVSAGVWTELPATLPLKPIWWGLAVDSIFYAFMLGVTVTAWTKLRSLHRRRRGLCPGCAYAIGDFALCPECGTPTPAACSIPMSIAHSLFTGAFSTARSISDCGEKDRRK